MEYVAGKTLKELTAPRLADFRGEVSDPIAVGDAWLARCGIDYRDIKPANIMRHERRPK